MKKIFVISMLALLMINTETNAQTDNIWRGPVTLNSVALKEGANTINLNKVGQGTLLFTKTGNDFSNMRYLDSAGKVHVLTPTPPGTQGAPKPDCKYPLPDACYASADKNIGVCFCKTDQLSANGNPLFTIRARVEQVREIRF